MPGNLPSRIEHEQATAYRAMMEHPSFDLPVPLAARLVNLLGREDTVARPGWYSAKRQLFAEKLAVEHVLPLWAASYPGLSSPMHYLSKRKHISQSTDSKPSSK